MKKVLLKLLMLVSRYTLRLFLIQVICINFALAGASSGQDLDQVKVSLSLNRAKITDIFQALEHKTSFRFAYPESINQLNKTYDIHYSEASMRKVLKDLSLQGSLCFNRINNTISVIYIEPEHAPLAPAPITITISGKVLDDTGNPLPGVNVLLKGTSSGTVTDADGNYTLTIGDDDANGTLVFSFIGYATLEEPINSRTAININLKSDMTALSEVVVIGYQTVEKRDLTGAVSVVNPATSNRVTANSLGESIQGLAPGVTVRNGGAPGQMARIEIRGAASMTNTDPLYIIDGMIADANTTINNNDIESIQILKDASAAAIYGSRAANGVIIVTTKKGKEGPAKITFSAKYGAQHIPKQWDVMNSSEFAAMQRTQYQNSGVTPLPSVGSNFNPAINTDWQKEMLRTGNMQDYNLSMSGGSVTSSYMISGSYYKNEGVVIGNSFNRGSLRINTSTTKGRVTFGENLVLTNTNTKLPREGNAFYDMPQVLPVIPVQGSRYVNAENPEGWGIGTTDAISYAFNPVAVKNLSLGTSNYAKAVGNVYADAKLASWLTYRFNAGLEVSFDLNKTVRKLGVWQYGAAPKPSSVDEDRSRFLSLLFEHTLNFNKTFGDHSLNGVLGISSQHTSRENTSGGRADLQVFNGVPMTTIGSATGVANSGGGTPVDYRIFGYLGRVNYAYKDKYLVTLTGRIDKDSRFGANYRTGTFHSEAVAWRISSEDFYNIDWMNSLKLHASYGELGINPLNSWDYSAFINNAPRAILGDNQTPNVGMTQAQLTNPDLRWEARKVKNIGVDASFLQDRVSLSIEAYNSLSQDALVQLPVAGYLGNLGGNPFVNAASVRNTGIEVMATYRSNQRAVKWDISGNFTTIKNTVEDVGNQGKGIDYIQVGNTRTKVGRSLGEWYLIRTDGLFQSQAEIDNYKNSKGMVIQPNAKPGDVKYIDRNGDGTINVDDRDFVGSPWPKLQAGLQFNASYKQFSLNVQFVGVFGYKIYNDVKRILDSYQRTNFRRDVSPWSETNTGTSDPRIALDTDQGIIDNNRGDTERWLSNASYVRLRNIELGYQLPSAWLTKLTIQRARIYISGQNLFTITGYNGLDPDVVGNTDPNNPQNRILERGVDLGNWPASRVLSAGLQFEF
jgi:TonB-linked SusC/RagA family outer membrane protein